MDKALFEDWSERCKNGKTLQGRHIPISSHPDHEIQRKLFLYYFHIHDWAFSNSTNSKTWQGQSFAGYYDPIINIIKAVVCISLLPSSYRLHAAYIFSLSSLQVILSWRNSISWELFASRRGEGVGDWEATWEKRREKHPCDQMMTSFLLPGPGVYDLAPHVGVILVTRQVGKFKQSSYFLETRISFIIFAANPSCS